MSDPIKPHPVSPARAPAPGPAEVVSEEGFEPAEEGLQVLMADLHHRVAVAAYFLSERRGFEPEDAARWSED